MKTDKVLTARAVTESNKFVDALALMTGADRGLLSEMVRRFALSIAGKRQRQDSGPVIGLKVALEEYQQLFRGLYRREPNVGPSDYAMISALIRRHGLHAVLERMRQCAAWDDEFWKRQGFSVTLLSRQWDRLTALAAQSDHRQQVHECQHIPPCRSAVAHSQRYLREMQATTS